MKGVRTAYAERGLVFSDIEAAIKSNSTAPDVSAFEVEIRNLYKEGRLSDWKDTILTAKPNSERVVKVSKGTTKSRQETTNINELKISGKAVL